MAFLTLWQHTSVNCCASGILRQYFVSAVHGSVVVGARVVRAERLATLLFLALAVFALHVVGVLDRSVTVGTADGVAVLCVVFIIPYATRRERQTNRSRTLSIAKAYIPFSDSI